MGAFDPSGRGRWVRAEIGPQELQTMNRRELGLGVATTSLTLAAANGALAQARATDPQVFIAGFDAQAGRLPAAQQADVRAVYQLTQGKPIWTGDRLRVLQEVAAGAERHGLPAGDFFDFVGQPALKDDVRFFPLTERVNHLDELYELIEREALKKPTADWVEFCDEVSIPCMPVLSLEDLPNDPHMQARGRSS